MKKPEPKQPNRSFIEVEPSVARAFEEIRGKLGKPHKITLATAALRRIAEQVKAGDLEFVNGELRKAA